MILNMLFITSTICYSQFPNLVGFKNVRQFPEAVPGCVFANKDLVILCKHLILKCLTLKC